MGKDKFTSLTHPMQVDFIPLGSGESNGVQGMNNGGELGMTMCPGRNKKVWARDLNQDVGDMHNKYRVEVVVTLVRSVELKKMGLEGRFFETITNAPYNMISRHYPIKDKWLPKNKDEFHNLVLWIIEQLNQGRRVVVHCNGGKGRAATVCCAVLMKLGNTYQWSRDAIHKARQGTLVNPIQKLWLRFSYARYLKQPGHQ